VAIDVSTAWGHGAPARRARRRAWRSRAGSPGSRRPRARPAGTRSPRPTAPAPGTARCARQRGGQPEPSGAPARRAAPALGRRSQCSSARCTCARLHAHASRQQSPSAPRSRMSRVPAVGIGERLPGSRHLFHGQRRRSRRMDRRNAQAAAGPSAPAGARLQCASASSCAASASARLRTSTRAGAALPKSMSTARRRPPPGTASSSSCGRRAAYGAGRRRKGSRRRGIGMLFSVGASQTSD